MMNIPDSHPRAYSLRIREKLVDGFVNGLVAKEGLIAHGRGEAFDYLIGERTTESAAKAIEVAASVLVSSKRAVLSINGNVAALCAKEVVELANVTGASIEVNLFYRTAERESAIKKELEMHGARNVLGTDPQLLATIAGLDSERRRVDKNGILAADTVFVPLEDGDRTEALVKMGKFVIAVDLNPLSRTAKAAHISIVDNLVRVMPALVKAARDSKCINRDQSCKQYDNVSNLEESLRIIRAGVR